MLSASIVYHREKSTILSVLGRRGLSSVAREFQKGGLDPFISHKDTHVTAHLFSLASPLLMRLS